MKDNLIDRLKSWQTSGFNPESYPALKADLKEATEKLEAIKRNAGTLEPLDSKLYLVAWAWHDNIGFTVGRYWYTEDSNKKVWVDDEGLLICNDDEVVGWFDLKPFENTIREEVDFDEFLIS